MAENLLAVVDERNSLGGIDRGLGQFHHSKFLLFSGFGGLIQTVAKAVVVVAADIADVLQRACGPVWHAHLRMFHSTGDSEFEVGLSARHPVHKACI